MVQTYAEHACIPFDLRRSADKGQLVDPDVKLKQRHNAAALQTLIHLQAEPSNARMILLGSLVACWMTEPKDKNIITYKCMYLYTV